MRFAAPSRSSRTSTWWSARRSSTSISSAGCCGARRSPSVPRRCTGRSAARTPVRSPPRCWRRSRVIRWPRTSSSATRSAGSTTARRTRGWAERSRAPSPTACDRSPRSGSGRTNGVRERPRSVVDRQLRAAVAGLDRLAGTGLVIAYEPVWAIGTGDAASGADAQRGGGPDPRDPARARPGRGRRGADPVRRQRHRRQRRRVLRPAGHRRRPGRWRLAALRTSSPRSCARRVHRSR